MSKLKLAFSFAAVTMLTFILLAGCGGTGSPRVLEDSHVRAEVTPNGGLAVTYLGGAEPVALSTGETPAFALVAGDGSVVELTLDGVESFQTAEGSEFGPGHGLEVVLEPPNGSPLDGVSVEASLSVHEKFPGVLVCRTDIEGLDQAALEQLQGVSFYRLGVRADLAEPQSKPHDFYLFQGAGYNWGRWFTRIKVTEDYSAANWTVRHLPEQEEGGGYPINYLWTRKAGLAIAQIDTIHQVLSLPVKTVENGAVSVSIDQPVEYIRPGGDGQARGVPVMIGAFKGDYFEPLRAFGKLVQRGPFRFPDVPPDAYEPIWCGWGFGRNFTPQDIYKTLPEVKKLGIPWVVIDDGFQQSIGAWPLITEKFPRGDADMRALVDSIHAAGFKAKLWWVPMNVQSIDPLLEEHPDWLVLDSEGRERRNDWWDVSQLCPAVPGVVEQQRGLVRRFLIDWDFDGFKMDGGCLGMVPPCHNPAHNHEHPEESCRAVATLFKMIMDEAERIKPGAVIEVCECGIPHDLYKMQYYNQQVSADPVSSDQVRARLKAYRALLGDKAAVYGDHVELSTGPYLGEGVPVEETGDDFASTLALGGVIGSKFTGLADSPTQEQRKNLLGDRAYWTHWFNLYDELQLYKGTFLNLYDIGWDVPETYVVSKDNALYFGMFAQGFNGQVELRGLTAGKEYILTDYSSGKELGRITSGENDTLDCAVDGHLLVRAIPAY